MPTPLTVIIPTLNESAQIAECVRHLTWSGEVIVSDGGSSDGTVAAARGAGARVIESMATTIAGQRNEAIAVAKHEWVYALDADERIGIELARELAAVVSSPRHEAYAVRRRNVYLGRTMRYAGWGTDWSVRLFRRERRFVERRGGEGGGAGAGGGGAPGAPRRPARPGPPPPPRQQGPPPRPGAPGPCGRGGGGVGGG